MGEKWSVVSGQWSVVSEKMIAVHECQGLFWFDRMFFLKSERENAEKNEDVEKRAGMLFVDERLFSISSDGIK
jgi:hypothetical protein